LIKAKKNNGSSRSLKGREKRKEAGVEAGNRDEEDREGWDKAERRKTEF